MLTDPPALDQVEVSIFGPGKGESIVVHLGDNRWIVVDSCVDQRTKRIAALSYLEGIGVDASEAVLLVVATHAHDDHFAGIAEVLRTCETATFVCSEALTRDEFFALTRADAQSQAGLRVRAFSEYQKIFEIIKSRSSPGPDFRPLKRAIELRPLLSIDNNTVRVMALSPSDEAVTRSLTALSSAFPSPGSPRKLINIDPNELAVALWIEVPDKAILLGADLLTGPAGCGWLAVLRAFVPDARATVFKVSHHGSDTGHHDDIWTKLLDPSPIALLAPFRAGKKPLPSSEDRARILSFTSEAFITASPRRPAASRATRKETVALGPLARNVRDVWGNVGQVRARSHIGDVRWDVEISAPGQRLSVN
jgi:beta-lactamase superfamily II metal-dependent hydrolase